MLPYASSIAFILCLKLTYLLSYIPPAEGTSILKRLKTLSVYFTVVYILGLALCRHLVNIYSIKGLGVGGNQWKLHTWLRVSGMDWGTLRGGVFWGAGCCLRNVWSWSAVWSSSLVQTLFKPCEICFCYLNLAPHSFDLLLMCKKKC